MKAPTQAPHIDWTAISPLLALVGGLCLVLMVGLLRAPFVRTKLVPFLTLVALGAAAGLGIWTWGDNVSVLEGALRMDDLTLALSITDQRYIKGYKFLVLDPAGNPVATIMNKEDRPETRDLGNLWKRLVYVKKGIPIPESIRWDGKSDAGTPARADFMKAAQICAGNEPPVTFLPCTLVISIWPSTCPIQTAATRSGV